MGVGKSNPHIKPNPLSLSSSFMLLLPTANPLTAFQLQPLTPHHQPYHLLLLLLVLHFQMFLRLFLLILQLESRSSLVQCNGSQSVVVQEGYLKWIKQMSSLRHSVFQKAEKQKHKPCLTIKVEKKTGAGDFVSVQRAIDSIPEVNLCRVIISIGPGAYK